MDLRNQHASSNVEDRRGMGMGRLGGGLGIGGIVIALIGYFVFGIDPGTLMSVSEQVSPQQESRQAPTGAPADEMGQFVSKVLGSTEAAWTRVFRESNAQYRPPTLVLYEGQVRSACGMGQSAMGPFYCPGDEKLYIDLSFYRDLQTRFRAPGDFAQAYVIAHEVGHHVQKLTGGFRRLEEARGRVAQREQTQGRVVPESFTHGSSEQRVRWFRRGLESGRPRDCDTFSAASL
jgi:predicted metalloprotease